MTEKASQRYRFGDYELDTATRQLSQAGEPVTLQPRVFNLLAFLITERHRAVDKDAIQEAVWAPMIVSETALTRAIMKARRAVGDDAESQTVIRTVHGHGYQFVAPLEDSTGEQTESPAAEAAGDTDNGYAGSHGVMRWLLAAAAVILLVGVGFLWRSPATPGGVRVAVMPVLNETGDIEFDWARFGLMGLANDLFIDATGLNIVSAADVVRFVENNDWAGQLGDDAADDNIDALRRAYGATHILVSQLRQNVGGLRLTYTLVGPDDRRSDNTMVSEQAPQLVRGMVRSVSVMLGSQRHLPAEALEIVDDDPFINEAYARGTSFRLEGRCAEALPLFEVVLARGVTAHRARYEWASCARILGRTEEAESAFQELLQSLEAETSSSLRADVLAGLGIIYHRTGRLDEAEASYQAGLDEALRAEDRVAQGRVLINMAILEKDRRDFAGARALLARATLAYRELEWEVLPGQISSTLANIAMNDGKLDEAEEHLDDALFSFRQVGDRRNEAMMLNNYGFLRRNQGRFEEAEPLHLQSLEIRREIGDRVGQGRILGMLSILYERQGRLEEARQSAADAVAMSREANDHLFLATGLAQLGMAEYRLGNIEAAKQAYDESRTTFIGIDDHSRAAQVDLRLVKLDIDQNNLAAAEDRIHQILELSLAQNFPEPAIEAMDYAGDVAMLRNDPQEARERYEDALAHIEETGFAGKKVDIAVKLANLYLDAGDLAATEPLLGYIVEQDGTADTFRLRARYSHRTGDRERSVSLMETAKELAKENWSDEDSETLAAYRRPAAE